MDCSRSVRELELGVGDDWMEDLGMGLQRKAGCMGLRTTLDGKSHHHCYSPGYRMELVLVVLGCIVELELGLIVGLGHGEDGLRILGIRPCQPGISQ